MPDPYPNAVRAALAHKARLAALEAATVREMAAAWMGVEEVLGARITALAYEVAELQAASGAVSAWRLSQLDRYQALLGQVQAQVSRFSTLAAGITAEGQRASVDLGLRSAVEEIGAVYLDSGLVVGSFEHLTVPAVESLIGRASDGSPLSDLLRQAWPDSAQGLTDALVRGMALGDSPRVVAAAMQDGLTNGLDRMMTIARTEMMQASREASREQYTESGLVSGYRRIAALDACLACYALDGETYDTDTLMELHPNDRCAMIPIVEGLPTPDWVSGQERFEALTEEQQRGIMGDSRYELWQSGVVADLHNFVTVTQNPQWGPSLGLAPLSDLPEISNRVAQSPTGQVGV